MTKRQGEIALMTRNFLAEHGRPKSPRAKRRMEQWQGRKKARKQQRMQERGYLATPLLKGVK